MAGFILLAVFAGGLMVWTQIVRRAGSKQPILVRRERTEGVWSPVGTVLSLVWLMLNLPALFKEAPEIKSASDLRDNALTLVVVYLVVLAVLPLRTRYRYADFGITLRDAPRQLRDGLFAFLAALIPVFLMLIATLPFRSEESQHVLLRLLQSDRSGEALFWISILAVVLAPLAEELMFRVILQGAGTRLLGEKLAIPIVAAAFSVVHGWPDMLPIFPLALVLGYVFDRQYSYLSAVFAHALFNGMNVALSVFAPQQ